jgi:hypothetical protein
MCGINGRDKPGKERMDLDFFKRASKEARDAGVEECGLFFIGESTMDPRDGIVPDDLLAYRRWVLGGGWSFTSTLLFNGAFYSQPRGWKFAIDCIGQVPRG